MKIHLTILLFLFIASCSPEHYETKATIIERRILEDSSLLIKYSFLAGNKTITDSVVTKNKVIPHDSLTVRYEASEPGNNTLKFE